MLTVRDFVDRLVLNEICDDFENVDQVILRRVGEAAAECGVHVERADVVAALGRLVGRGLVKAYRLEPGIQVAATRFASSRSEACRRRATLGVRIAYYFYGGPPASSCGRER